jgi:membrane peptidoglycan carboxypeptidase
MPQQNRVLRLRNVILSGLGQNEFLDSMERAAALAMDMQARKKNYGQMSIPRSWGENLAGVMEFMEGRL